MNSKILSDILYEYDMSVELTKTGYSVVYDNNYHTVPTQHWYNILNVEGYPYTPELDKEILDIIEWWSQSPDDYPIVGEYHYDYDDAWAYPIKGIHL